MRLSACFVVLMFFSSFVFLSSCKSDPKRSSSQRSGSDREVSDVSGILNIEGDDVLQALMSDLVSDFRKDYPNVRINLTISNSSAALNEMNSGNIDLAFISTRKQTLNQVTYTAVPFARDALVLIVNFNNMFLQTLAMYGISRNVIADILSLNITSWKKVSNRIDADEPLVFYIPPRNSGTIDYLAEFSGLKKEMIKADDVIMEKDVPVNVSNQSISAGFCSHTLAYDHQSKVRRSGLYIVGIDLDNSNFLENNELIYDDLMELATAVKHNKAPETLIREFSLVYRNDHPDQKIISVFVEYIIEKGNPFIEKHHFYTVNHKSKTNT